MKSSARWSMAALALCSLGLLSSPVSARGGWAEIVTAYCFEAEEGQDAYVSTDNTSGNLDGQWRRSNNSDEWDGSTPLPGEGAPGGVMAETLSGEGEDGGDASVLAIEDVVTSTSGDLNNRKIFLWRDTSTELDLSRGVTLVARWRLSPEPHSAEFANNGGSIPVPDGYYLHNANKGQLGFVQKTAIGGTITAGLMFAITDNGHLQFAQSYENAACAGTFYPAEDCVDVDETGWVTLWFAAIDNGAGGIDIKVYLNGSMTPIVEGTLTGIDADTEDASIPETGGTASSYIILASGSSGQTGAIQVDYLCAADTFIEPSPEAPDCPSAPSATVQGKDVVLAWTNGGKVPSSADVLRDGLTIAEDVLCDPPSYTDVAPPPGDHGYELQFIVMGEDCPSLKTTISTCPVGLSAKTRADGILLEWTNWAEYSSLKVSRDGAEIASIAGTETSYLDAGAESGSLTYTVAPGDGTCTPLQTSILYIRPIYGSGDFGAVQVSWDYELDPPPDADPGSYLLFQPTTNAQGSLDGMWSRGNGSDSWDSSAPGEIGDPTLDVVDVINPAAAAPGGIGLVTDGDVGAYLIEDVGIPTEFVPPWLDPSNRKIYTALDLALMDPTASTHSLINDGFTLRARFRLTPADRAVDVLDAPNGSVPHSEGKGMFTLDHDGSATGLGTSQRIGFALDMNPAQPGTGLLIFGQDDNLIEVPIPDPTAWLDVWLTVSDPDPLTPEVDLKVYLNGSETPTIDGPYTPTDGGAEYDPPPGNSLYMGIGSSPESGSMEVDLLSIIFAVQPPVTETRPFFRRGDADDSGKLDLTDAIATLQFLYMGYKAPTCKDAADTDDSGTLDLTDAISSLQFQFMGGLPPASPGPVNCGPDPTDDQYKECTYTNC
jgi:hypothetical protein